MAYLYVNTKRVDDRGNDVKWDTGRAISEAKDVVGAAYVLSNPIFNGKVSKRQVENNVNAGIDLCRRAEKLMRVIDEAGEEYEACEVRLKKAFDDFDAKSVKLENEIRRYLGLEEIKTHDAQVRENWTKVIGGIVVVAVGVGVVVLTGGAAAPFLITATVSTASSAVIGGTAEALSGGSFWDGFSDGFLDGAISGTASGIAGGIIKAKNLEGVAKFGVKLAADEGKNLMKTGVDLLEGKEVSGKEVLFDVGASVFDNAVFDPLGDKMKGKMGDFLEISKKAGLENGKKTFSELIFDIAYDGTKTHVENKVKSNTLGIETSDKFFQKSATKATNETVKYFINKIIKLD